MDPAVPAQDHRILRRQPQMDSLTSLQEAVPSSDDGTQSVHDDFYPDYSEDWIDFAEAVGSDYLVPSHVTNVPSQTTHVLNELSDKAVQSAPSRVRVVVLALRDLDSELHEHANTMHGVKDLLLDQNRDVHELAINNLILNQPIDHDKFPEDVREFPRNSFKQKKDLLFISSNGILCTRYPPTQRSLHERTLHMIVLPQL